MGPSEPVTAKPDAAAACGGITERERRIARVLRPLGRGPMTQSQAERAGQLLGVHWTTVYRLRARFLRDPVVSALAPSPLGRRNDSRRLAGDVETVITEVVRVVLLPKHES